MPISRRNFLSTAAAIPVVTGLAGLDQAQAGVLPPVRRRTLHLDVFTSDYKPVVNPLPNWPVAQQATFPASTATLISGEREAVLVDALITRTEVADLVAWIRSKGKKLTTIYITHAHFDHFYGLSIILDAFPGAVAVTLPEVVPHAQEQLDPAFVAASVEPLFPGQLPAKLVGPESLSSRSVILEGHEIQFIDVGQGDTHPASVVHIPELRAVVGGDVAYNGIHMWFLQTDHAARMRWLRALDIIESLRPEILVAGHKDPAASDRDVKGILARSRRYIRDFDAAVEANRTPDELIAAVLATYPKLGNPWTLWVSASSQYPGS